MVSSLHTITFVVKCVWVRKDQFTLGESVRQPVMFGAIVTAGLFDIKDIVTSHI